MKIELVFFEGCPHVESTRNALRDSLEALGKPTSWIEWDLNSSDTPIELRPFPSPTVLINGTDVDGASAGSAALSCRASGAPSSARIIAALKAAN